MQYKILPVAIRTNDPFAEDALNRKDQVSILNQFVASVPGPFVLALNGAWGTGKTVFVKMWAQELRNAGYKCLYFNAWENDFTEDPLVALIEEMAELLQNGKEGPAKKYYTATKKCGRKLIKSGLPLAVKLATSGLVDLTGFAEALPELAEKIADQELKSYEEKKKTIGEFRKALEEFADKSVPDPEKKLLFFVDELDRCRPTYAIQVLERIKHLFDVRKIVFVLSIDRNQLSHSVRGTYGSDMDANGYLQRFIDLEYTLPDPNYKTYASHLFRKFGFVEYFDERKKHGNSRDEESFKALFAYLAGRFHLSLRAQERLFTLASIALSTTPPDYNLHPVLLVVVIFLSFTNEKLFNDFKISQAKTADVLRYLIGPENNAGDYGRYRDTIEAYLVACKSQSPETSDRLNGLKKIYDNQANFPDLFPTARHILGLYGILVRDHQDILSYVVNKIEMASQFVSIGAE